MKIYRRVSLVFMAMIVIISFYLFSQRAPIPPVATRLEHKETWHGETVDDPYFWLREKDNPEVTKYLEAENAYAETMTKDLKPFQEVLYTEMLGRIKQTDLNVPVRRGKYYYYSRTGEGKQYPIYCRKSASQDGSYDEESSEFVLLDQNEMAKNLPFLNIGAQSVSDDDNLLAYSTDQTGFLQYSLHVKDLRTNQIMPNVAERVTSVVWAADNKVLFYTTEDKQTKRSDQLWRLRLGDSPELLYTEQDALYRIWIERTKDKRYLILRIQSIDTWEMRVLDSDSSAGEFKIIFPREKGHKYEVEHRDGLLYIRTNNNAKNFRIVTAPVADPRPVNWKEFIPHKTDTLLRKFDLFKDFAVVNELHQGVSMFRVFSFSADMWHDLSFPETLYSAFGAGTPEFDSRMFRINYQSMITSPSVYDYDLQTRKLTLLKQEEILGGYNPSLYETERLWVTARDGMKVPISIVYKKGFNRDGRSPLLLFGYGAYGYGIMPIFLSERISLLDRGFAYAIAHIRGGNEMGEKWHENGMLMAKKNTFTDFIDCAEYLINDKWTSRERLVIMGHSAGGLLMGAVTNMRPDLFKAVHTAVPWVDVMNDMMDATIPLTVGDYLEWGNPNEKAAYDYMKSYSPYDNIERKTYPAILVTTSFNDSQVMYWGPAKYVAKMRSMKTDKNELLLKCKMEPAGHGGASGRYDRLRDIAFEYAWMMKQVGINH